MTDTPCLHNLDVMVEAAVHIQSVEAGLVDSDSEELEDGTAGFEVRQSCLVQQIGLHSVACGHRPNPDYLLAELEPQVQ
tara:strand:+ start:1032 stop:1268 length:237 start_codon:yes stop_codon:yes gene_type:complete